MPSVVQAALSSEADQSAATVTTTYSPDQQPSDVLSQSVAEQYVGLLDFLGESQSQNEPVTSQPSIVTYQLPCHPVATLAASWDP